MILALLAAASAAAASPSGWHCRNQVEIWCDGSKGCRTAPAGQSTPLDIWADRSSYSVCAYTGCWQGKARVRRIGERHLWAGKNAPFSTAPDKEEMRSDVTLLIFESDGVGFVRAGGLATPLLCERADRPF
ncbi:MAG: hypothetical protein HXY23_05905 [Parvularculaceae bacterium]|nr:hypothetical protein [Parvularculaceae bacterium]